MIGLRIGYALLLLAALGPGICFAAAYGALALTLLLVLTPLGCIPLHLLGSETDPLRLDAPVNLGKGETGLSVSRSKIRRRNMILQAHIAAESRSRRRAADLRPVWLTGIR